MDHPCIRRSALRIGHSVGVHLELPPLPRNEAVLRRSVGAQSWSASVGCGIAVLGLLLLAVPGHLGMTQAAWVLTGGSLLGAGLLNVAVALLSRRRYTRRLNEIQAAGDRGDEGDQPL